MRTVLAALSGPQRGMYWELPGSGPLTIGRDDGCTIRLDDPYVGREQATIEVRGSGGWGGGGSGGRGFGGSGGARVWLLDRATTNPTLASAGVGAFRVGMRLPARWVALPRDARLLMGTGTYQLVTPQWQGWERSGGAPLQLLLPALMGAAMIPFALGGPGWRWLLVAAPLLVALAALKARAGMGGKVPAPRRGELAYEIALAADEGRAFHSAAVWPQRPRVLRGDLTGTGWWLASEAEACWLAGFLAVYNDPAVVAVKSPWLSTQLEPPGSAFGISGSSGRGWQGGNPGAAPAAGNGSGLLVRFEARARAGPSMGEMLITWGTPQPSWAVPLRMPAHMQASAAWARRLAPPATEAAIPEVVHAAPALGAALAAARRQRDRAARQPLVAQQPRGPGGQLEIATESLAECDGRQPIPARAGVEPAGLAAELGASPNGPVLVDLVAEGPHALIAGTTGAGKSELLTTWILGLAARYSPARLALVLVDFKGGAAFGPLTELPHTTAVLTDLDAGATRRALASMRALLRAREVLLREAGCRDVAELDQVQPGAAPRLLVVIDEFRALADDHPDLMAQLLRLGAQGRSLGVHLIAATQRPSGAISPDLRANMPLRICLRVAEAADSHDVISTSAAATLPRIPGRAIIAPGLSEFQVAWSGEAQEVAAAVSAIRELWPAAPQLLPWRPLLPAKLDSSELPGDGSGAFALADYPDELAQRPLLLPRASGLVVGPPHSGRTSAAIAIASAALTQGDQVWVVSTGRLQHRSASGAFGGLISANQTRLVTNLLEHCTEAPGRTAVLDDVEIWLAAYDSLHGSGSGAALLARQSRAIAAAGSRLFVTGSPELVGARWASTLSSRYLLAGTDPGAALLAGIPRESASALKLPSPGRAVTAGGLELQFAMVRELPPGDGPAARQFEPLPPLAQIEPVEEQVILGIGGDPLRTVHVPAATDIVIVGLGTERDLANQLVTAQASGRVLAVTPQGWATGWSGELGRIREHAAVIVVRPDLTGAPQGINLAAALEPGGAGYAVLVHEGEAIPFRLGTPGTLGAADAEP